MGMTLPPMVSLIHSKMIQFNLGQKVKHGLIQLWQESQELWKRFKDINFIDRFGNTGDSLGATLHLPFFLRCSSSLGNKIIASRIPGFLAHIYLTIGRETQRQLWCIRSEFGHVSYQGQPYPTWVQVQSYRDPITMYELALCPQLSTAFRIKSNSEAPIKMIESRWWDTLSRGARW